MGGTMGKGVSAVDNIKRAINGLHNTQRDTRTTVDNIKDVVNGLQGRMDKAETTRKDIKWVVSELQNTQNETKTAVDNIKGMVNGLQDKIAEAKTTGKDVKRVIEGLQNTQNETKTAVDSVKQVLSLPMSALRVVSMAAKAPLVVCSAAQLSVMLVACVLRDSCILRNQLHILAALAVLASATSNVAASLLHVPVMRAACASRRRVLAPRRSPPSPTLTTLASMTCTTPSSRSPARAQTRTAQPRKRETCHDEDCSKPKPCSMPDCNC
jgi:ABC-type transporter Mla subunit MlaD